MTMFKLRNLVLGNAVLINVISGNLIPNSLLNQQDKVFANSVSQTEKQLSQQSNLVFIGTIGNIPVYRERDTGLLIVFITGVRYTYEFLSQILEEIGGIFHSNGEDRNSKDDQKLTAAEIKKLKDHGINPEELKGGVRTGQLDLFKDKKEQIYVKPKNGSGDGEDTGYNINDF